MKSGKECEGRLRLYSIKTTLYIQCTCKVLSTICQEIYSHIMVCEVQHVFFFTVRGDVKNVLVLCTHSNVR